MAVREKEVVHLLSRRNLCYKNVLLEISVTTAFVPKYEEEI